MSTEKTNQESLADGKPSTRKYFYGAIGLLLAGLLVLAVGAIYSLPLIVGLGLLGWLGAGLVFLRWLQHRIG